MHKYGSGTVLQSFEFSSDLVPSCMLSDSLKPLQMQATDYNNQLQTTSCQIIKYSDSDSNGLRKFQNFSLPLNCFFLKNDVEKDPGHKNQSSFSSKNSNILLIKNKGSSNCLRYKLFMDSSVSTTVDINN